MSKAKDLIKVPRLGKGKGLIGPEHYGCSNTGHRPLIYHSKVSGKYFVGPELDVGEALNLQFKFGNRRKVKLDPRHPDTRFVYIFKTRAPAVTQFHALCDSVLASNETERTKHQQALRDANSNDPEKRVKGALDLLDF